MLIRKATLCSFGSRLTPPLIKIAVKIVNRPLRSPHGTRLQGYERELLTAFRSLLFLKLPITRVVVLAICQSRSADSTMLSTLCATGFGISRVAVFLNAVVTVLFT